MNRQVPSIVADFSHLKMLGHVYVVEDARDVAQIVRDVTRYGGAYRPEVSPFTSMRFTAVAECSAGKPDIGHIRIHSETFRLEKD